MTYKMRFADTIRKITVILVTVALSLFLFACGGQKERDPDIPTKEEAEEEAQQEKGINGARVLDIKDVRNDGAEYYNIDAVYTMTCDRMDEFILLRTCSYDTLFGTGFFYGWLTDYSDAVLEDYLLDHKLPEGICYSTGLLSQSNYGAAGYFGDETKQIWFEFDSDEEFEAHLDDLEPWLDEWLSYERQYLAEGKDPEIRVAAYRPQDDTMKGSIRLYRVFGHEKDSFHVLGADGETYRWSSFRKAMEKGYGSKKDLMMK